MLGNYILTSFRNIIRYRGFTFINIAGLSISMAICMLIIAVVRDQYSYDRYNKLKNRIYRIESIDKNAKFNISFASTTYPLADELTQKYGFVEEAAIFNSNFYGEGRTKDTLIGIRGLYANSSVLKVFQYPLKWGNAKGILDEPYTIVLQEDESKKFFGETNPVGKYLQIDSLGNLRVTGVIAKTKQKSHIRFEALVSAPTLASYETIHHRELTANNWHNFGSNYIYLLLRDKADPKDVQKALDRISLEKYPDKDVVWAQFYLQPLTRIVPGPLRANEIGAFLYKPMILFLAGIGLVLIILAAFNYTSLSIARSLLRAKEVGIRKTIGAARTQLIIQFLAEALLITLFSLVLAVVMLQYLLPGFTGMKMMSTFEVRPEMDLKIYGLFFLFAVFTGLLSGILPAIFMSSFDPQKVLKGLTQVKLFSRVTLRKFLLVTQFTFSIVFVISVILVFRQMHYMVNAPMGFERDLVYNIRLNGNNFERVKDLYAQLPEVVNISGASHIPGTGNIWDVTYRVNSSDDKIQGDFFSVDAGYIPAMGLTLLAGENFPVTLNTSTERSVIVNETCLKKLNLGLPAEAIGKNIILNDSTRVTIIGVVKDYNYSALFLNLRAMALRNLPQSFNWIVLRLHSGDMPKTVNKLRNAWLKIDRYHRMNGDFLDAQIRDFYSFFDDIIYIVGLTSLIVIVIACLGLLGMATYSTQTRIKEIAVRKVQGAKRSQIVLLISRGYLFLLLIASVIAIPIAYFANLTWFRYMSHHVSFGLGNLLAGTVFVIIVGLLTIASQTVRAANIEAARTLKYE